MTHISGAEYIEEKLLGLSFRISPGAFFQVNTAGAEIVYQAAIDLAQPTIDTGVLDICCGTGTIGLCFAKVSLSHFEKRRILYLFTGISDLFPVQVR